MLAFANVMDFLSHELSCLRRRGLPGSLVRARAL